MAVKKKNVIVNFFTKDWDKRDIIEKLGLAGFYVIATYGTYQGIKYIIAWNKARKIKEEIATAESIDPPTYTPIQYDIYAQGLHTAMEWADDEEAIRTINKQLLNNTDVLKVIESYQNLFDSDLATDYNTDLDRDDFWNGDEIEKYVNKPLRANGVTIQF
tara:strand:+ start:6370 stop:6849 length:480 start_codon:yes stop_codon:yes gene_type:complete